MNKSKSFVIYDEGIVDGDEWFSLRVKPGVYTWITEQDKKLWHDTHYMHLVDVHRELLLIITLKFP